MTAVRECAFAKGPPLIMYHNITSFPRTLRIYATRYDRLTPYITVYTCLRAVFYVPARITVVYRDVIPTVALFHESRLFFRAALQ